MFTFYSANGLRLLLTEHPGASSRTLHLALSCTTTTSVPPLGTRTARSSLDGTRSTSPVDGLWYKQTSSVNGRDANRLRLIKLIWTRERVYSHIEDTLLYRLINSASLMIIICFWNFISYLAYTFPLLPIMSIHRSVSSTRTSIPSSMSCVNGRCTLARIYSCHGLSSSLFTLNLVTPASMPERHSSGGKSFVPCSTSRARPFSASKMPRSLVAVSHIYSAHTRKEIYTVPCRAEAPEAHSPHADCPHWEPGGRRQHR